MVLYRLADFISWVLTLYTYVILAAAVISWVNPDPYNPIAQILRRATEPVLRPIRNVLARFQTGFDFSPLVAILIIQFIQRVILPF